MDELLVQHYDPAYTDSIQRNFPNYLVGKKLVLKSAQADAYSSLAREVLALN